VGAAGTITGMANLTPRACVRIWELFRKGDLKEAQTLQGELSVAEWGILIGGIPGIKVALYPNQCSCWTEFIRVTVRRKEVSGPWRRSPSSGA
jgi:dihydrodipicolinate synthase/N-acetylneuraminate lyase